jgi:hypothetical protein
MTPQELLAKWNEKTADNRTEEQKAFDAKVEAEWAAYDAEINPVMAMKSPDKWAIAEEIAQKYRRRGIVFPRIVTND